MRLFFFLLELSYFSLFFTLSDCTPLTVLKVGNATGISVFGLWKQTGLHCVTSSNQVYRHDFIDRMDNVCVKNLDVYFRTATSYFRIRYSALFTGFSLDMLMSATPNEIEDNGNIVTGASYSVLINTDGYEFALLSSDQSKLYAEIYYVAQDPVSPKFGFSTIGITYKVRMWAATVTGFSSEYTAQPGWTAKEILGPNNFYPNYGDKVLTWAAASKGTSSEYIQVAFVQAVYIEQVNIYETCNAGGVKRVSGKTPTGTWYILWQTTTVTVIKSSRIFSPTFTKLTFLCNELKIEIDQSVAGGYVELDAVQIVGTLPDISPSCLAKLTPLNLTTYQVPDVSVKVPGESSSANTIVITCTVLSKSPVTAVRWTKDGNDLVVAGNPKYSGMILGTHNLTISNADPSDSGKYMCYASNLLGESQSGAINIVAPTVVIQGIKTFTGEGDTIVLTCTVSSNIPITAVKWTKDGNAIPIADTLKYSGMTLGTHNLTVNNTDLSDSGNYMCCATNVIGGSCSAQAQVTVTVQQVQMSSACFCDCKPRPEYMVNHTTEEWRQILAPILLELEKNLTIDKLVLSKTIRQLTSATDKRVSSESLGMVGVAIISTLGIFFVLIDVLSLCKPIGNAKKQKQK